MAEEIKQEATKESKSILPTLLKVLLGIVFLVLGVLAVWKWFYALKIVFSGCIGLFLILAGLITLAIAKE